MRSRILRSQIGSLLLAFLLLLAPPAGAVTFGVEAYLASGAAAFHNGDFQAAEKAVDSALALEPTARAALELKALLLKTTGRLPEAFLAYQGLLRSAKAEKLTAKLQGAYLFEIGLLDFSQGQFRRAAAELARVRLAGFNIEAAAFFQALAQYRLGELTQADDLFAALSRALGSSQPELKASSEFYRARIALDRNEREKAIAFLETAKSALATNAAKTARSSDAPVANDLGTQISELVDTALGASTANRVVAGIETLTEYDSNATLLSDTLSAYQNPATLKQTLLAAVADGRRTSTDAWSVSGRSIINYNASKQTKSAEFAANELEGTWLFKTYGASRLGLALHGLALFRNQSADGSSESFKTYLLSGVGGLAFERLTASGPFRGQWKAELGLGPATFLDDSDFDSSQARTGSVMEAFVSWRRDLEQGFWNPGARTEFFRQMTNGSEFRGTSYRLSLGDTVYVGQWRFALDAGGSYSTFPDRPGGKRTDWLTSLDSLASRALSTRSAFLLRAGLATNSSSVPDLYSYNRYSAGLGLRLIF
jgi:tetratricopeptide (TPR) repeat protein